MFSFNQNGSTAYFSFSSAVYTMAWSNYGTTECVRCWRSSMNTMAQCAVFASTISNHCSCLAVTTSKSRFEQQQHIRLFAITVQNILLLVLELQKASLHLHTARSLGLCAYDVFPSRVSLDFELLGRPDHPHLELAVPHMYFCSYRPQSLCDVCHVPSEWGSDCQRITGSDCTRMGHRRYRESWRHER